MGELLEAISKLEGVALDEEITIVDGKMCTASLSGLFIYEATETVETVDRYVGWFKGSRNSSAGICVLRKDRQDSAIWYSIESLLGVFRTMNLEDFG